jgi:nitrogen regulatory protein P-II 1
MHRDSFFPGEPMKLITCVIRPERVAAVKESLFRAGVTGITLSHVTGHGGEREVVEQYRGSSLVLEFHDKVKIEMACSEPFVEATIQAIVSAARTGEVGDALTPITADEVQARAQAEQPAVDA